MIRRWIAIIVPGLVAVATMLAGVLGANRSQVADFTSGPVAVYVTARDTGQRLARTAVLHFVDLPQPGEKQQCVFVDLTEKFQTVLGIGGALTDADQPFSLWMENRAAESDSSAHS